MQNNRQFNCGGEAPEDVKSLAYIGDAVCSLFIRQWLCGGGGHVRGLTERAARYASAAGQAKAAETLLPMLSEEEADVYRRGRNAKCGAVPRGCDPVDYRKATGFEALMGWLYAQGKRERLEELLTSAYLTEDKPVETP
jgi:ribonuclease-3 family protein